MTTISLNIKCGKETCASEPGRFCEFFMCGFKVSCALFGLLEEENGWVQRATSCKEAQSS
jgi:hypothetical protein